MNRFLKLVLPGVAAIAIVGVSVATVHAQPGQPGMEQKQRMGKRLNLTDAQKQQMQRIRNQSLDQVRTILNESQKQTFDQARQNKTNLREAWRSLNLSEDQKKQVKEIMQASRKEIFETVLTQEQRDQMQQMRRSQRGRPGRV